MVTCPSTSAAVGQGHRPHFQSPNGGQQSLSRKSSWSVQAQPSFVDFDSLLFLCCNTVVVSLHATVAPFQSEPKDAPRAVLPEARQIQAALRADGDSAPRRQRRRGSRQGTWKLSTLPVVVHLDAYPDFLRVLATAASQTSGSSDTVPPSASGKRSALWNRRATTGIFG